VNAGSGLCIDLTGKRVLVTGASHGIGFGVAEAFARCGADLTILSSTTDIEAAAIRLENLTGRRVQALVCDITDRGAVRKTVGTLPGLDVLVNNAGLEIITSMSEAGDAVEETFARIIQINVIGTYYARGKRCRS
jgi:3-hydroxybutyrate dehydrogenase